MKSLPSVFASFLCAMSALAAAPECEWVFTGGGEKSDKTRGVAFDRQGNVFLASESVGDSLLGDFDYKSAGGMDCVVTKLDREGRLLWARGIGGSGTDRAYAVACDAAGNAYVTGHFDSTDAVVGKEHLPNAGSYDCFVAKYSPDGRLLWIRTHGGPGYDYGHAITVDPVGSILVSGSMAPGGRIGEEVAVPEGAPSAVFCAKYDADGRLVWAKTSTGKLGGNGYGISTDAAGNIYIGGAVSGAGELMGLELRVQGTAAFVMKMDPAGRGIWSHVAPGAPTAVYHEMTCDSQGRVWAAGMFKGAVTLDGETHKSLNNKDNDGMIVHFDQDGKMLWNRTLSGPGTDYCLGVAVDEEGNSFVSGDFHTEATLAGHTLVSRGGGDLFLAGFDVRGNLAWVIAAGGAGSDTAYPIAFRAPDALLLGGSTTAPGQFAGREVSKTKATDFFGALWRVPARTPGPR